MLTTVVASVLYAAAVPATPSVDVILARHDEDLSWLAKEAALAAPRTSVLVYNKGKGADAVATKLPLANAKLTTLPNFGRESHTYLSHIVENYDRLADWSVFSQAGEPSFGYKGHRDGGGHLVAGHGFSEYLEPTAAGAHFVYTAAVQLAPPGASNALNHALRADYCVNNASLPTAGGECPKGAAGWSSWWELGWFSGYIDAKVKAQHGEGPLEYYRKYIDASTPADQTVTLQFAQGARFSLSKEVIRRRPKAEYEAILATLSHDVDPYSGYYMEWMWPALFLGASSLPCALPPLAPAVGHSTAMDELMGKFVPGFAAKKALATERALTVLVLTASGDVSDYTPAVIGELRLLFAGAAGVVADAVGVAVTAGSVTIRVTITSGAAEASTVLARLQAVAGTPSAATAFFATVSGLTITVLSIESLATLEASTATTAADDSTGAVVGGVLGGLVGVGMLVGLGLLAYKRGLCNRLSTTTKLAKVVVAPPEQPIKQSTTESWATQGGGAGGTAPPSEDGASEAAPAPAAPGCGKEPSKGESLASAAYAANGAPPIVQATPAEAPAPAEEAPTGGYTAEPAAAPAPAMAMDRTIAALPPLGAAGGAALPPIGGASLPPIAADKKDDKPEKGHRSRAVAPE